MKPSAIVLSAAVTIAAAATEAPADTLVNDTFEREVVHSSPRVAVGTDPVDWANDSGDSLNANGLTDLSVEGVGGPQGGSQTMLFYDSNAVDGRIADNRTFTPVSTAGVLVTLDFRVNRVLDPATDKFAFRLITTDNQVLGFELAGNESSTGFDLRPLGHTDSPVLGSVTVGHWYHASLQAPGVAGRSTAWKLTLHNYTTAKTDSYELTLPGAPSGGYARLLLQSGFSDGNTLDMSFDNIKVEADAEVPGPPAALLLFGGGLGMWHRRWRSGIARR